MPQLIDKFIRYNSRPDQSPLELSPYFIASFERAVARGDIAENQAALFESIVNNLSIYRKKNNLENVVIGISGGIDSALVAALFKAAGWSVAGILLPINQNEAETDRGMELVDHLGISHRIVDLTAMYGEVQWQLSSKGLQLITEDKPKADAIRRGNMKARLRMITLYELAAQSGGLVASTDNFSELFSGFWTLHGDVGDLAPVQSLTKSWEIPYLADSLGIPKSIIEAAPTDGLGIDNGDEAQFGYTYAQADLLILDILAGYEYEDNKDDTQPSIEDRKIIKAVLTKVKKTAFKRANPTNLPHPESGNRRYEELSLLDNKLRK